MILGLLLFLADSRHTITIHNVIIMHASSAIPLTEPITMYRKVRSSQKLAAICITSVTDVGVILMVTDVGVILTDKGSTRRGGVVTKHLSSAMKIKRARLVHKLNVMQCKFLGLYAVELNIIYVKALTQ